MLDRLARGGSFLMAVVMAMSITLPAQAASLQVSPVSLQFSPGETAQGIWLSNTGTAPLRAQVRVMAWSQQSGKDELQATRLMLISPPIVEIPAGERQLVRVIRPDGTLPTSEQTFRLLIDELPDPTRTQSEGLQFLLQYSVPVFIGIQPARPTDAPTPLTDLSRASFSLQGSGEHQVLTVANHGSTRLRISQLLESLPQGNTVSLNPGLVGYVLVGQRMSFPLDLAAPLRPNGLLKAQFNDDQEPQAIPLQPTGP